LVPMGGQVRGDITELQLVRGEGGAKGMYLGYC
jgi:hypothetical protein